MSDPESDYYQGAIFSEVLSFIKDHPQKAVMRQKNDKLTLRFENVKSIQAAINCLVQVSPDRTQPFLRVPEPATAE